MKIISFSNKKGGVVFTTLCKNVTYKFVLDNKKVLLIDLEEIKVKKVIQSTKYKNIDIIVSGEKLRNINLIIKELYDDYQNNKENIVENIYLKNQETFDGYDYVLIDYPPTVEDFSLDLLLISDLILIPINEGINSFKGILDLINSLKYIANKTEWNIQKNNIIFNNIKDNENLEIV